MGAGPEGLIRIETELPFATGVATGRATNELSFCL